MSLQHSGTWWSQRSLANKMHPKTSTFLESSKMIRKESILPQEKHTFFPGNEISRNRVQPARNYLIRADSKLKLSWEFFQFLITIYLSLLIPFSLSYFYDRTAQEFYIFSAIFIFDIFIELNSSYFDKGVMIETHADVMINYLKTWFVIDFLAAIPTEAIINFKYHASHPIAFIAYDERNLLLLKLLKLIKTRHFSNRIAELSNGSNFFTIIKIAIYCLHAIMLIHWINCIFNMLYTYSLEVNWVYWPDIRLKIVDRYLIFADRIVQTMTSVGYGDFTVRTPLERIGMVICMMFTSGFLGFFVGRIEIAIIHSSHIEIFFRKVRNKLLAYYEKNPLPKSVKNKVNAYIRHLRLSYNENLVQDEDIIKYLSIPLREQIFLCTKGYVLIGVNFFSNLSRPCIRAFGYKMSLQVYGPFDSIFSEGELTTNLYFISVGRVQIFHGLSKTVFTELHKDNIFGEISFLLEQGRSTSARCSDFSELFSLNRYDCKKILETMPKDQELFKILLTNVKTYGLKVIGISCYLCGSYEHIARSCSSFIIKPSLVKRKPAVSNRMVNLEYSPNIIRRRTKSYRLRYGMQSTKGRCVHPLDLYEDNRFLARKSVEFHNFIELSDRKLARLLSLVEEDRSFENSSEESEKNFVNFKVFDRNRNTVKDSDALNKTKLSCNTDSEFLSKFR